MVRQKSRLAVVALLAVALAMVFAFAGTAAAAQQNPECLSCHQSMTNWSVPPVDKQTACVKCHTEGLLGTHPRHYAGGNCGAVCHLPDGWGESLRYAIPAYLGPEGSFASSSSVEATASLIHIIHMNPRWPGSKNKASERCSSCHGIANCSTCHQESAIAVRHATHSASGNASYTAQPAWVGPMSHGINPDGDMTFESLLEVESQCAADGCHNVDGASTMLPVQRESHSHPPVDASPVTDVVTYAPVAWKALSNTNYTLGRAYWANQAGYTLTSTFPANIIEVVTDVDPYRGMAEVWIDGEKKGDIDCYSPTTGYQRVVFRSADLGPGDHTVQIRVTGTKNPASRGTYVVVDGFRAYQSVMGSIAPKCVSCHPDKTTSHGFTFDHVVTNASFTAGTYAGFACSSCHNAPLVDEHRRDSSKTKTDTCTWCHTTYAPYLNPDTTGTYDRSCTWNGETGAPGCHKVANNQQPHGFIENDHTPDTTIASEAKCRGCHNANLDVIHNDSVPTNGFTPDCLDCHSATSYPSSKACTGGCHVASGVDAMEHHPYLSASHVGSGADTGVANTGGLACNACHDASLELYPEHTRSTSRLVADGSAIICSTCHDQSYLPRPWNDQCVACHTAGKAPVPHNAFATKHDYSLYSAANQTSCGGVDCHDVTKVDLIHATSNPGNGSCQSCHTALEGVPTKKLCTNCHTAHNTTAAHNAALYPNGVECVRCHDGFSTIDVAHPSCVTCHNVATGQLTDYLNDNYTAECTSCHATGAGKLGSSYMPWDPDHYVGTETTHTASSQTGTESGFACTSCHNMEMKPEHIVKTKTNFVGVPGTYPDKCIACHEQRVDSLPGGTWNKTCDQCHATKHTAKATQHNATNTTLSGVLSTVTVESEDFGASTTWPSDWTRTDTTYVRNQNTRSRSGYAAEIWANNTTRRTAGFYKDISLSGYEGTATISFWYAATGFAGGSDVASAAISFNGGATWTSLVNRTTSVAWSQVTTSVPATGTVRLWFGGSVNSTTEFVNFDDILVEARQRGTSPGTAGANCAGTGCHNVADVAAIHNESIPTNSLHPNCLTCHNATPAVPVKDCNAAGCHNGGHNPAAHTALTSEECVLCHETNNIQAVHPNCDTCHANPSYPGIVSTNTAECVDCHNASEVYAKTYSPSDPNHYIGTETTHTSTGNGTYNGYSCTQCHLLEMKPEHAKPTVSFATTTTVIGKCIVCHETKVDSWITAWDKKCASCHPSTHTDRATKHNATTVGAGCGGTGCHAINDVAVIHNNSITTNSMVPSCVTCHSSNTAIPTTIDCESAGCHLGMQHGHALDLSNSNYNNTTVTGCTNSGIGCHGSMPTSPTPDYAVAQYHPDNGCQSGLCHKLADGTTPNPSQSDPAFNNPQTCQNCHGGRASAPLNYTNAPDVIALTASSTAPTGGHYNETSHTIVLSTQTMNVGGAASATCVTCHNATASNGMGQLYKQHQVLQVYGNTTCYDCHSFVTPGDVAGTSRVGNVIKNALATNQDLDCIDCHNALVMGVNYVQHETTSSPPATATVMSTPDFQCGDVGCHYDESLPVQLEIHELHKGDGNIIPFQWFNGSVVETYPAERCNGTCHPYPYVPGSYSGDCERRPEPECVDCHDPLLQGWKPTAKTCGVNGACHITSPHTQIGPAHSVTALSQACVDCHETTDLRSNHGYPDTENCASNNICHDLEGTVYTYNGDQYTFTLKGKKECRDCHSLGKMPNVTRDHAPHDPNHYLGSETTHTAINQTGGFGAIYSVVATEGFNSATWPAAWTRSSTTLVVTNNSAPLYEGTYHAQIYTTSTTRSTNYFQRTFDTAAVASPTVEFYYTTTNFASPDYARLEYSVDGTNFVQLWNTDVTQTTWTKVGPLPVPRSATLTLRFSASTNANNSDRFRVDAITLKPGDGIPVACSSCHYMELKPEHFKASSEATRVPGIYPDKCVDCHENKTDVFDVTKKSIDWNRTCNAGGVCHTSQHLGQTAKHDASAVSPACGGSGCHYIQDVAVIHNNSSLTNATVTTCANTCHTTPAALPASVACGSAGCHEGMGAHNHELDRDGSLFNPTTVTGCVDSGAGCHGNSPSTNYQSYHPNSGCLTGPCHTAANHNDPQFNDPNTCMNCHGGGAQLYAGATDRIPVAGASPDGHYPENLHTAASSSRTASVTAGGTLSARCIDCHSDTDSAGIDGLYYQHQALPAPYGNTTCVDCHNYSIGVTAQVTGSWTTDSCSDCHNVTDMPTMAQHGSTAPVVTATEAQGAGSCVTTGCHATTDLHALHKGTAMTPPARAALGCAFAGCHDYTKQGLKPTAKSCGTGGACHTTDAHNPAAHNVIDSANCTRCHEGAGGTAVTDIRNVYKSTGFGNVLAHDNCASCHNAGSNLGSTNTADCVDCHNALEAGTHAYTPYDPNHYYTSSHDSSLTTGANYGTSGYGKTLTDYHGATVNFERACTTCHTIDLKTEHDKTSVSFNLGGKADKCVACHELKVDNWSARWTGSCAGEASSCHNLGALHSDWSTKHDASTQTMAAPGSSFALGSTATVFTENFGTTTTWPSTWTRSNTTYVTVQTGSSRSGAAAQIGVNTTRTEYNFYLTAGHNLSSYGGGTVQFWYQVNVSDTADFLVCEYSTAAGGPYTELFRVDTDALTWTQSPALSIPGGATIYVRFRGTFNATGEYGRVDDFTVNGVNGASFGAALPANSTAAVSCQNNPNGTECHNVADVANIHSRTPNYGCPICHTGTSQHATQLNCQATGCHVGINVDNHNTAWHESSIASNTTGAYSGTSFTTAWCRGCHDDSIDNEHFVLGAYGATPCSVCHKKSSDSAAPISVTSAVTSSTIHADSTPGNVLCETCHTTVQSTRPHVQRWGWSGTPNGGSGAVGNLQFQTTWSGHRVLSAMPGAKTSFTTAVDGVSANRTWSLPADASWLAAGWTSTSMVVCSDCHGDVSGATGPHGASMTVKIASGYNNNYSSGGAYLNTASPWIQGNPICAKCHQVANLGSLNNVHSRSDHRGTTGGKCINCHVKIPHAWKRPRLIGYRTDPAPYAALIVNNITDRAYTPTGWSKSYCGLTGCGSHSASASTPLWP